MTTVYVVGSVNTDQVFNVTHLASAGETVPAHSSAKTLGGKGANQAVAAAKAGATVSLIAAVGTDEDGCLALSNLIDLGIDTSRVARIPAVTGSAMLQVDALGENCVVTCAGANSQLSAEHVQQALSALAADDVVLCQGEIPLPAIVAANSCARKVGAARIINLAPVVDIDVAGIAPTYLIVNEHEAASLAGSSTIQTWAQGLAGREASVVITRGARGATLFNSRCETIPAFDVARVVDTTGAGDAFCGAFATAIGNGSSAIDAMKMGAAAASICITHPGAQAGEYSADMLRTIVADRKFS